MLPNQTTTNTSFHRYVLKSLVSDLVMVSWPILSKHVLKSKYDRASKLNPLSYGSNPLSYSATHEWPYILIYDNITIGVVYFRHRHYSERRKSLQPYEIGVFQSGNFQRYTMLYHRHLSLPIIEWVDSYQKARVATTPSHETRSQG